MKVSKKLTAVLLVLLIGIGMIHAGVLVSHADTSFDEGDFRYTVMAGDVLTVSKYYGDSTVVELPAEVNGRAVTGVYTRCFEETAVTSVVIPEGYTFIGGFAFSGCESLAEVMLPSTLKNIGTMAFYGCHVLRDIDFTVAVSLQSLGFAAFSDCAALETVALGDSVTSIGENVFCNCSALSELQLSANLSVIPEYAFYGCAALASVAFPASVTTLGDACFEETALSGVWVPDTITSVGSRAFAPANDIICFSGSAAAQYCADNEATAAVIIEKIKGDANTDGKINVNDVTAIQRHLAELEALTVYQQVLADVCDGDGVNVSDASMIQMYLAEFDVTFAA